MRTVFVAGGLYGNPFALAALERRAAAEGAEMALNGDWSFLNTSREAWEEVTRGVLRHPLSTLGNIELAVSDPEKVLGCGCNYPAYFNPNVEKWAGAITSSLVTAASQSPSKPSLDARIRALPANRIVSVGPIKVGLCHGSWTDISSWALAVEALEPLDPKLRSKIFNVPDSHVTRKSQVSDLFVHLGISLLCCSHTCIAFGQSVAPGLFLFNNGALGMPNFTSTHFGVATRISCASQEVPPDSLYGVTLAGGVRVDAVPVHYDHAAFLDFFLKLHRKPDDPARLSYEGRIRNGLSFWSLVDAQQRFRLT